MPPELPEQEHARLRALDELAILDTDGEQSYDDLVALAARIFDVPIALVSLVGRQRQWFKARVGLEASQTDRSVSFCAHAIESPADVFVVEDATADPRFADNPLVTGPPHIRFYAGAPIVVSSGFAIGTICVIDHRPRHLDEASLDALRALSRQAAALVELRRRSSQAESLLRERDALVSKAEVDRRHSAELLELVLRGGDLGLWDLHVPTGTWTINAREHVLLGYTHEEATPDRLDWKSLIHPDDRPSLSAAMAAHLRGETTYCESTHRMRHRDGRWIWVLDRSVAVERDAEGAPLRIVGTHMDVTDRKRAEEDRRESRERLEFSLEGGDLGSWDLDVTSGKAVYNPQWWALFGYAPGELDAVEGLWKGLIHPDDWQGAQDGLERHMRGETPSYEGEVRMRHRNGAWLWVHDRAKVVARAADGSPLRVVGINMNITARKNSEDALRRATDLLKRTGTLARVGGWELDVDSMKITWSDEVYRIHEIDRSSEPDLTRAIDFYAPESRPAINSAVEAALARGTGWDLELQLITASGRRIWVRALGEAEFAGGRVVRLFGAFQDITDRMQAQIALVEERRRLRLITDNLPALVTHIDSEERYTFANAFVGRVFGIDPSAMLGHTMREIRGETLYAELAPQVRAALDGEAVQFEGFSEASGRRYHYQSNYIPDVGDDGTVRGFYAMTFDITERKQAELRSADSERLLRGITDNVPALIAELDDRWCFRFCNATYQTWLGIDPASMIGRPLREALGASYYQGRHAYLVRAYAGERLSFEQTVTLPIGERTLQTTYIPHCGVDGAVAGVYALTSDVSKLKEQQLQLNALARQDALTGLSNRRVLEEHVEEAMARTRRSRIAVALLYLDIDRFKAVNDAHGHAAGDAVLREFSRRLSSSVRDTDLVARYGGDEFVILLEGVAGPAEAEAVGAKILAAMTPTFDVLGHALKITTSVGVALFDGSPGETFAELLARADAALYMAKGDGRDRLHVA